MTFILLNDGDIACLLPFRNKFKKDVLLRQKMYTLELMQIGYQAVFVAG